MMSVSGVSLDCYTALCCSRNCSFHNLFFMTHILCTFVSHLILETEKYHNGDSRGKIEAEAQSHYMKMRYYVVMSRVQSYDKILIFLNLTIFNLLKLLENINVASFFRISEV